jgi:hypothetical protein
MPPFSDLSAAAEGLAEHPQDHGWRTIYKLFDHALRNSSPQLERLLWGCYESGTTSPTHLLTLLGIAIKLEFPAEFKALAGESSYGHRTSRLEDLLAQHAALLSQVLMNRRNSFTCARRFLVTQVLLSACFPQSQGVPLNFADLGTGLGILPRQLNSSRLYERFCQDLAWPGGVPAFKHIPLSSVVAVDRGPLPSLDWVHACYGSSDYYTELYEELLFTLADPDVARAQVTFGALDITDTEQVARFIEVNKINAANLTYVLYELPVDQRKIALDAVLSHLHPPGLLIVTEPCEELHQQGCVVELYQQNRPKPLTLFFVSDGHFKGHIIPLEDYEAFNDRHPIAYRR